MAGLSPQLEALYTKNHFGSERQAQGIDPTLGGSQKENKAGANEFWS